MRKSRRSKNKWSLLVVLCEVTTRCVKFENAVRKLGVGRLSVARCREVLCGVSAARGKKMLFVG